MVGVVLFLAGTTAVNASAQRGGAAREDAPHGPVMVGVELVAVGAGVGFPVLTEQVCQIECHEAWRRDGSGIGEGGERVAAFRFADLGEVEVADDFLERAVAEIGGDLPDGGSAFQQVGGEAVTQRVGGKVGVLFGKTGLGGGDRDGLPDGGLGHGLGRAVESLGFGEPRVFPAATDGREEPFGIAVIAPEGTQPF